jgi:hypothetical protein
MSYASLRQGLVGAWCPSLGPSGNTLLDRSGYGNHGTLTNMDAGTDWVGSRYGWALDFDGANDYVNCGSQVRVGPLLTLSIWVNTTSSASGRRMFANEPGDFTTSFSIYSDASQWYFFTSAPSPDQFAQVALGLHSQIGTGQWVHLAVTYDGGTVVAYRNGVSVGSSSWGRGILLPQGVTVLGATFYMGSFMSYFSGSIADARLYSRPMTLPEIRLLGTEPGIGLKPERTSVFFGADLFSAAWLSKQSSLIGGGIA